LARTPARRIPAVFLDRDGVLTRATVVDGKPYPAKSVDEAVLLPGVRAACRILRDAGLPLICVTNQPDISRGTLSSEAVAQINGWLLERLGLSDIRTCPHDDADDCACRKPRPGLLLAAAADHGLDLAASVMVGDRWRDMMAADNAGCIGIFIDHGYAEPQPIDVEHRFASLRAAVPTILRLTARRRVRHSAS
jgi:D-glycero-D-manno-heptose 1,7-bisphosphate phosphatase